MVSNRRGTSKNTTRRTSSRSNKFVASLKEPDGNSIHDVIHLSRGNDSSEEDFYNGNNDSISSNEGGSAIRRRNKNESKHGENPRTKTLLSPSKTKVVRHSSARKHIYKEDLSDDESMMLSVEESSNEEHDDEPPKIQRIIAVRMETKRKWRDICTKINTSEIDNGSRWFQEEASVVDEGELDKYEERFLVKWADLSFLHCSWEKEADLLDQVDNAKAHLTTFFKKSIGGYYFDADERMDGEYFDPAFCQIERILEVSTEGCEQDGCDATNPWGIIMDKNHPDYDDATGRQLLIKWGNTSYSDASYEYERDLILMDVEYESYLQDFETRRKKPTKADMKKQFAKAEEERRRLYKIFGDTIKDGPSKETLISEYKKNLEDQVFPNGGKLRDYQAEGVSWLLSNHINERSSILADEMGLGKTIQTAAYVKMINTRLHLRGPFLIVAPLSTIPHWQREFAGWTNLNTIVYHGSQEDRDVIRQHEFAYECDRPQGGVGFNQKYLSKCHKTKTTRGERLWMVEVVITTPEMMITEDFNELTAVEWDLLVVDEAHRLKSHSSKLAFNLRHEKFVFNHVLLLTGTPIQNNMSELWALMNVIDPEEFNDCDTFMKRFDKMQSKDRVDELHELIRPYILRRLKEDVERSVPPKEETLIEVEMTVLQKQYYRALYEKNVGFLHQGVKKALDGPSLNNLSMQLRKCCNHPFLLEGVEEKTRNGANFTTPGDEADFLASASGKLVLLDKLLPKLKAGGHRVLLFSQFKIMLDIIEDYLTLRALKFERIDGSVTGKKRQMAIDRFQSGDSLDLSFIMLLSTRAGGVGINLTAADTCIIFDSDWNPQNDLQAQARCHRIGQKKSVKIYRLLTRKSYEMQMFHMSSMKMGLDQAVLQGFENGGSGDNGPNMTKEEVEKLLRHGAYDMFREEQEGAAEKESNEFLNQDIDTILERRTTTLVHENTGTGSNAAGGKFSKASFNAAGGIKGSHEGDTADVDIDDPDFWTKMVGEAKEEVDVGQIASGQKRARKKAVYNEKLFDDGLKASIMLEDGEDSDGSTDSEDSDEESYDGEDDAFLWEDFDLDSNDQLNNPTLLELKARHILLSKNHERRRWGGKKPGQWHRSDADQIVKLLHRFGYGNIDWNIFYGHFRKMAKKDYDDDEIKRMSWSICMYALHEAVIDNVSDTARRIDRSSKKKLDESLEIDATENGIKIETKSSDQLLHVEKDSKTLDIVDTSSDEWKEKQVDASFTKIVNLQNWIGSVLDDINEFSETNAPRDASVLYDIPNDASSPRSMTSLVQAFEESILPVLRTRGWTVRRPEGNRKKNSIVSPKGIEFRDVANLMDSLASIHPELQGTVQNIIVSVSLATSKISQEPRSPDKLHLSMDNLDSNAVKEAIQKYAPLQLVIDRSQLKRVHLTPTRLLNSLTYLRLSHQLVQSVRSSEESLTPYEKCFRLSNKLNINPKSALPHPQWTTFHDAVLITAITQHGWLDRNSHCKAILADKDIQWGYPFDDAYNADKRKPISEPTKYVDTSTIEAVATRAALFLNTANEDELKDTKGFNVSLVTEAYSIERINNDDGLTSWAVNKKKLNASRESKDCAKSGSSSANKEELIDEDAIIDLPTRKDLLRRARTLLTNNSNFAEIGSELSKVHDFTVLDQSNTCNIFLAELIREAIRVSQKKQAWISTVLNAAVSEATTRSEETASTMEEEDETKEHKDMKNILKHINLVVRHSRPLVRGSKNVLRAILGLELHQLNKSGESLFVQERKPVNISTSSYTHPSKTVNKSSCVDKSGGLEIKKKTQKRKKQQTFECTVGDSAVNTALGLAKNFPPKHGSEERFLKLSSIETLLLSVMCSQGIPICDESWHSSLECQFEDGSFALSWSQTGNVLEAAAEAWHDMTANKINTMKENGLDASHLLPELSARHIVFLDALQLQANPTALAKKAVMLLEAVRMNSAIVMHSTKANSKCESPIGSRAIQWSSVHLKKWAQMLGVLRPDGSVLPLTACFARPDLRPAAYVDEDGCGAIYSQIMQQTRLRDIFLKYEKDDLFVMTKKAIKKCKKNGNYWDEEPEWWGSDEKHPASDDMNLLSGILQYGYGGFEEMVNQNSRFSAYAAAAKTEESLPLDRFSAQRRLDMLTRELGILDDANESMQLLREAKTSMSNTAATRQIGIASFFAPKKIKMEKKSKNECDERKPIEDNPEDNDIIEIIEINPAKRKAEALLSSPSEKKTK